MGNTISICAENGESCEVQDCCTGLYCVDDFCSTEPENCAEVNEACETGEVECCGTLSCINNVCSDSQASCGSFNDPCEDTSDCCSKFTCEDGFCVM